MTPEEMSRDAEKCEAYFKVEENPQLEVGSVRKVAELNVSPNFMPLL